MPRRVVRFARPTSSRSFSFGKQTAVAKTSLTDECLDDFTAWAKERGYQSVSDCLRDMIMVNVYGVEVLASLHADRLRSLVPNWTRTGTQDGGGGK